jgi:hypothetical protein
MRKGHFEGENNSGGFSEKQLDISVCCERRMKKWKARGNMIWQAVLSYRTYRTVTTNYHKTTTRPEEFSQQQLS